MSAAPGAPGLSFPASLRRRESLSVAEQQDYFALLSEHFEGVTWAQFRRDLSEKNWVIEIRRDGRLLGFSTLLVIPVQFEDEWLTVIYSGDTIMAPEAWGSPVLARTWIAAVNALQAAHPERACYWLLLTSGFRTFRFLPVFWQRFFPHPEDATPAREQALLEFLAKARYGDAFDAKHGLVRFAQPQRLRAHLRQTPPGRATDPRIAFFLNRNPGHAAGDELVCLTPIHADNLTAAGRRMVAAVAP